MNYPRGTGLWTRIYINFRESIRPKNIKQRNAKKFVQKDYLGNSYYEIAADVSRGKKPIRSFIPQSENFDDFDLPIPPEWDAWLRHRRVEPPTEEEIQFHLAIQERKRLAAIHIDKTNNLVDKFEKNPFTSFPLHKEFEISPGLPFDRNTSAAAADTDVSKNGGKQSDKISDK